MGRYQYQRPGNEDEFEEFCLRFYRVDLKRENLERYGKRGERQFGIDLFDQVAIKPVACVQCKHREPHKVLTSTEIEAEVRKAEGAPLRFGRLIIATTARKSVDAQNTIIRLNERINRKFEVVLHFWDHIESRLTEFGSVATTYIVTGDRPQSPNVDSQASNQSKQFRARTEIAGDELYPEIANLFKQRRIEAARHEIEKLPDPEKDLSLTPFEKYSILRLRGKLALERLQFDEACRLFMLAYEAQPHLEQAKFNRILALEFSDDRLKAFSEAKALVDGGNGSPILLSLLVRNAPSLEDLISYQQLIEETSSDSDDVCLAMAQAQTAFGQTRDAFRYAERALSLEPDSAHAHAAVAMACHQLAMVDDWKTRNTNIDRAIKEYSSAIELATNDGFRGLIPELLHNRGRLYGFLNQLDAASRDYLEAIKLADTPALYVEEALSYFLSIGNYKAAQDLLPQVDEEVGESRFLSLVTKYNNTDLIDDKRACVLALADYANSDAGRSNEARFFCVQWYIQLKDYSAASQCVPPHFCKASPFHTNTLLAWIAAEAGDNDAALSYAEAALTENCSGAHRQEIEVLAKVFGALNRDDKALPLWEQTIYVGVLDDNCKNLLLCAQRLKRDDILIRVCQELRYSGAQDEVTRKLEVQLLSQYQPEKALEIARLFRQHDAKYFTAASNLIAVRLGILDQIDLDPSHIPSPTELQVEEWRLVVVPYLATKNIDRAIQFLYEQLRINFNIPKAHMNYFWVILLHGTASHILDPPVIVDLDCSALLENTSSGERRWATIEPNKPDISRDEFDESSPIAAAMLGRRVNDEIDVPGRLIQPQKERIVAIETKFVRLFQLIRDQFQNHFPGETFMQQMSLGSGDNFDPTPLIRSLEDRRQNAAQILRTYREEQLCSLHFTASRLGINELQLLKGLMADDSQEIRCVNCTPEQFDELPNAQCDTRRYVIDISAIVTLSILDAWDCLDTNSEFFTSRTTVDLLTSWIEEMSRNRAGEHGRAFVTDEGKLVFHTVTADEAERDLDELQKICDEVRKHCIVESSASVAALAPERRKLYIEFLGYHTLECMCVAKDKGALFWTDDFVAGSLANIEFRVEHTWTQLQLHDAQVNGCISLRRYDEASANLLGWNYVNTIWNGRTLICAGELSGWDANKLPLQQCVQLVGRSSWPLIAKARFALEYFRQLRKSSSTTSQDAQIVQAVLDSIDSRIAVQSMLLVLARELAENTSPDHELALLLQIWLRKRR